MISPTFAILKCNSLPFSILELSKAFMAAIANKEEKKVEDILSSVDATTRKTILDTAVNEKYEPALYKACLTSNISMVNILLTHGVDINKHLNIWI